MISSMREYFRSLKFILVIIVIAFVVTSVVYFGTGDSGNRGTPNIVGTVNGEEIPTERFRRTQANLIEQYERMTRQRLTPEMIERLGLNQRVMNELVNDTMVVQAAGREGVRVSDDELRSRIQEMREFQQDGRFSRDRYLRILKQVRLEPGTFETEMRRQLIRKKIEDLVKDGVKVSDAELQEAYSARNQRVRMAWASLDTTPLMAGVTVPDADLEPYVKAHQAQFTRPERRRIQYVIVSAPVPPQTVSDQDAQAYYDNNVKEYEQLPQVHAAHILVRVPPVGGSEAENKAKAKIEDVLKRARAGEDFAKLAKETSEDTANAQQGGDLGFVKRGDLVPQFEQAAFALKKGELAPAPVRTPFGYHAIKVLDVKDGGKTPFKDVVDAIKTKLAAKRAEEESSKKAEADQAKLLVAKDFAAEAHTLGLPLRDAFVGRGDLIVGIGRDPKVEEAVFAVSVGGTSAPIKVPTGYAIVKVVQQLPAGVPPPRRDQGPRDRRDQARACRGHRDGPRQGPRGGAGQERRLPHHGQGGRLRDRRDAALFQGRAAQGSSAPRRCPPRGGADANGPGLRAREDGRGRLRREDAGAPAGGRRGIRQAARGAREAGARAETYPGLGRLDRVAQARVEDRAQPRRRRDAIANSEGAPPPFRCLPPNGSSGSFAGPRRGGQ